MSEWNAGQLGRYDPDADAWEEWDLPGENPMAYAVYVDDKDVVWVSDFGANAYQRFDPRTERSRTIPLPSEGADVRQMLGRPGEVWGAESGVDKLVVVRKALNQLRDDLRLVVRFVVVGEPVRQAPVLVQKLIDDPDHGLGRHL